MTDARLDVKSKTPVLLLTVIEEVNVEPSISIPNIPMSVGEIFPEKEIEKVNNFLRSQGKAEYFDEILSYGDEKDTINSTKNDDKDELYNTAVEIIRTEGKASTSFLQRKLQIGYNRAARIIDVMEEEGIVSKANHVGKRDVLK